MPQQLLLNLNDDETPSLQSFIVGHNQELLALLEKIQLNPTKQRFVYIWGEEACGKTHLLKALNIHKNSRFLSPVSAIDAFAFDKSVDLFLIDDCDKLSKEQQIATFDLFNHLKETKKASLIISGSNAPQQLNILPDLKSRLSWDLIYQIYSLSDEEKHVALTQEAARRSIKLAPDVIPYLINHYTRDMHSLLVAFNTLDRYALQTKRLITRPLLIDLFKKNIMTDTLALFDLDNTLLPIDSDYEWGEFMVRIGAVDKDYYEKKNQEFFLQYQNGTLDPAEFLAFVLGTLSQYTRKQLDIWHAQFMKEVILPQIKPQAINLVKQHLNQNHLVAIVTATNRFITAPIARCFGVEHLIAATPEEKENGDLTGRLVGIPTSGEGKIIHTQNWLKEMNLSFDNFKHTYFYSDSDRDIPLLSHVNHPVAVNPNERLKTHALKHNWPILNLFND